MGVLNRVVAFKMHNGQPYLIIKIFKDIFNQIKIITVDKIQNVVSNYFNITLVKCLKEGLDLWQDQDRLQCS